MRIKVDLNQTTYPRCILEMKRRFGDRIALRDKDGDMTYRALCTSSEQLGAYLLSQGIRPGEKVVLHLGNTRLFIQCLFALELIGALPVIVFSACREHEVFSIADTAEAAAYISFRSFKGFDCTETATRIADRIDSIRTLFFDDQLEALDLSGYALAPEQIADPSPEDPAYIVLSGGSTGIPKLIPKKQAATLWSAEKCAEACGLDETTRYLTAMPCAHYFHICGPGFMGAFLQGATDILCYSSLPSDIVSLIRQEKITETALVPSVASECIAYAKKHGNPKQMFESLRLVQLGGAMCTADVIHAVAEEMGCVPQQIYGMGEGLVYATYPQDSLDFILKYQGINTSAYDSVKVVDEAGNPVPDGEFGELIAKGPNIATAYYKNDEANRVKFTADGYYRTGDRVCLVEGKYLQVVGRIDDMINRAGEKIFPAELEMHLRQCSGVREAAVFGIPDPALGSRIAAFVICDEDTSGAAIRRELIAAGLASFKIPDDIFFKDAFPLTSVKKIDKHALKQEAEERIRHAEQETLQSFDHIGDPTERSVYTAWARALNTGELTGDSCFIELGGNSITAAAMLRELEQAHGISLELEDFYCADTLDAFCGLVKERIAHE